MQAVQEWRFTQLLSEKGFRSIVETQLPIAFANNLRHADELISQNFFQRYVYTPSLEPGGAKTNPAICAKLISMTLTMASQLFYNFTLWSEAIVAANVKEFTEVAQAREPLSPNPEMAALQTAFYPVDQVPALFTRLWHGPTETRLVEGQMKTGYPVTFDKGERREWRTLINELARFRETNSEGIPLYFLDEAAHKQIAPTEADYVLLKEEFEKAKAMMGTIRDRLPQAYFLFDSHKRPYKQELLATGVPMPSEAQIDDDVLTYITLQLFFAPQLEPCHPREEACSSTFLTVRSMQPKESVMFMRHHLDSLIFKYGLRPTNLFIL